MSLEPPEKTRKLRAALHAKAKGSPGYRFYLLYDKVYRGDVLAHAYRRCQANGGAAGVDGQSFEDIEAYGAKRWLGELAEDLRRKTYNGGAVLLRAADRRLGLIERLRTALDDERQASKVTHELEELLAQRIHGIALGYPDANDGARLAHDPIHKLLVGRDPVSGAALASQRASVPSQKLRWRSLRWSPCTRSVRDSLNCCRCANLSLDARASAGKTSEPAPNE